MQPVLAQSAASPERCQVAAYYFPGYHPDPRLEARKGAGWTEWVLVKAAKHPDVPLWGYEDESTIPAMQKKIAAAADHGLDAFIFDWYWYEDRPYLNRPLDEAFLKAKNRRRLKFALMWANHDWLECMPAEKDKPMPLIYHGAMDRKIFDHATDEIVKRYFSQPNYWRVDGKPYFSIYELWTLVNGLGGIEQTRDALDAFRAKAKAAGLPGIYLNAVGWGPLSNEMVEALGIDSVTSYCWVHHIGLPTDTRYADWAKRSVELWPQMRDKWKVPYFPNVSVGWDNTPRFAWATRVTDRDPAVFQQALSEAKAFVAARPGPRIITINAWNEWTEGSYLEPDTVFGERYLNSIRDVFAPKRSKGSRIEPSFQIRAYADGRPAAMYRLAAVDQGVVLKHGDGPNRCDGLGAREAIVFRSGKTTYLHYDGAGPDGWRACLATSEDLVHWQKHGPVLSLGQIGEDDAGSASSPWVIKEGKLWHMFYMATPNASPEPERVPSFPYLTRAATSENPAGPWVKERGLVPFSTQPGTYYSETASPGQIVKQPDGYRMFFSASMPRTIGMARTQNLDAPWTLDKKPLLPREEQIENSSLYFEKANGTWFLFTNHIGIDSRGEYTDAIWVYWSKNLDKWDPKHKAVVLDGRNCKWSSECIGMPSVLQVGNRLAVFYDAPGGDSISHMRRDIGLAWLDLPLSPPSE